MSMTESDVLAGFWLEDLCKERPRRGPLKMRRWYNALNGKPGLAFEPGPRHAALAKLEATCLACPQRCRAPLV